MPGPRYTVSYTPPPYSPLAKFGAGILGYDCFEGTNVAQLAVEDVDPAILSLLTVEPRRFGLHASFVPPFRLHNGSEDQLFAALELLAKDFHPISIGPIAPEYFDAFIVLRAEKHHARLHQLASACRAAFASFHDIDPGDRPAASIPDDFCFHMKLAGPLQADAPNSLKRHFARAFEKLARDEVEVGTISLMRQDDSAF